MTSSTDPVVLHLNAEDAMLAYALVTVRARAIPELRDGQKPVQRRILYAMHELKLAAAAKPVKGARIVGEVLGKYHPHGDSAAYDAMVRMAQEFTLRYPLVKGEGNFGSRDGDGAAAMRYTEAKLEPISELLLGELEQGCVDFMPNYDGTFMVPRYLPARLPFSLLNGSKGIAVGLANEVPPHNIREVGRAAAAVIENPELSLEDILDFIPGPDFPDGGQVISSPAEIRNAYTTGRGSIRMRGVWTREDMARGQWQIVFTELPYQVSTRIILEQLGEITNPQPKKGKKTLDQAQVSLKQRALELLDVARDESGKGAPVRLVIEPKTAKVDPDVLLAFLFANTSLEASVPVNLTGISLDNKPRTVGIDTFLKDWAVFRVETVKRRTQSQLDKVFARLHILEGRVLAFTHLDKVLRVIREADDPRAELQSALGFSEIQADDILEMRLRQLNRLEGFKLENEIKDLGVERDRLQSLLSNEFELRKLIVSEIEADVAKHGDDRRTLLKPEARAVATSSIQVNVVDEPITVVLSKNLWLKAYKGWELPADTFTFRAGDSLLFSVEVRSVSPVYFLGSNGRAYSVPAASAPAIKGDGTPLSTLLDVTPGTTLVSMLSGEPSDRYIFAGDQGYGYMAPLGSLATRQRAGKDFLSLADATEQPMAPVRIPSADEGFVICGSTDGRMLAFPLHELMTRASGGKGVVLMVLDGEKLSALQHSAGAPFIGRGKLKDKVVDLHLKGDDWEKHVLHRARKGAQLPKKAVLLP